mmetsp:Transcript_15079/g.51091  ORF Transcript_15079/g.51091 Transcript_15079/m.51091 type:complete len:230 (+) Transcript_15079:153-842(+)
MPSTSSIPCLSSTHALPGTWTWSGTSCSRARGVMPRRSSASAASSRPSPGKCATSFARPAPRPQPAFPSWRAWRTCSSPRASRTWCLTCTASSWRPTAPSSAPAPASSPRASSPGGPGAPAGWCACGARSSTPTPSASCSASCTRAAWRPRGSCCPTCARCSAARGWRPWARRWRPPRARARAGASPWWTSATATTSWRSRGRCSRASTPRRTSACAWGKGRTPCTAAS